MDGLKARSKRGWGGRDVARVPLPHRAKAVQLNCSADLAAVHCGQRVMLFRVQRPEGGGHPKRNPRTLLLLSQHHLNGAAPLGCICWALPFPGPSNPTQCGRVRCVRGCTHTEPTYPSDAGLPATPLCTEYMSSMGLRWQARRWWIAASAGRGRTCCSRVRCAGGRRWRASCGHCDLTATRLRGAASSPTLSGYGVSRDCSDPTLSLRPNHAVPVNKQYSTWTCVCAHSLFQQASQHRSVSRNALLLKRYRADAVESAGGQAGRLRSQP